MAQGYRFSLLLLLLVWPGLGAGTLAQAIPPQAVTIVRITLGNSTAPLYWPWKFQVGDSPVDPVTHVPLWAQPGFDDSNWETVDLTPPRTSVDPVYGPSEMVPGWTARGHAGHSGYGWYRMRVQVAATAGEKLALEGPPGDRRHLQALSESARRG